jgi:hypothetical protein
MTRFRNAKVWLNLKTEKLVRTVTISEVIRCEVLAQETPITYTDH